jgi:proline iminopeptidase
MRAAAVLLLLLMVAVPFLVLLAIARAVDSLAVTGVVSALALLGVCLPVVAWISRRLVRWRGSFVVLIGLSVYLLATGSLAVLVFARPLPGADVAMPIQPSGYWELPTGSKIAYLRVPACGTPRSTPVIRIHGGYGEPDYVFEYDGRPNPRPLDRLAENGFDVYYYDQIGCGNSGRLTNPREYTIRRHVEDLEEIRRALGVERVVLVALSFGSTLAAQYCAAYPNGVAKVVFESPGPIWPGLYPDESDAKEDVALLMKERMPDVNRLLRNPRAAFLLSLYQANPALAARVVPETELAGFVGLVCRAMGNDFAVCDRKRFPPCAPRGIGGYGFLGLFHDYPQLSDPRPALVTHATQVLVLRGEGEWLKPQVAEDYVRAFPNSTFAEVQQGGHLLYLEQPEEYIRVVRSFLIQ